ncbi:hypothetical protein N7488_012495 [Penicillium malachiteum]|nr:hypothetical protein N7488_012495 [Penicillium malachiteum]
MAPGILKKRRKTRGEFSSRKRTRSTSKNGLWSDEKDQQSTSSFTNGEVAPPSYLNDEEQSSDQNARELKYQDLDLHVSYVDKLKIPVIKRGKKQIWPSLGDKPMNDRSKVPPGWNDKEPDLDPEDYDAQIQRCDERIREGIMPLIFEWKKEDFQNLKAHRDKLFEGLDGYSRDTAQRIICLEKMVEDLQKPDEDYFEQISNAWAILEAYRSRKLEWIEGLVTYWSKGKQISEPRPFVMQEFTLINLEHEGDKSFWVEGINGPGPMAQMLKSQKALLGVKRPNDMSRYNDWSIRIPGMVEYHDVEVMDDSGCDTLCIFRRDLVNCQKLHQQTHNTRLFPRIKLAGVTPLTVADGNVRTEDLAFVEVNIKDENGDFMTTWDEILCVITNPPIHLHVPRLSGHWLRYKLYTAGAPYTGEVRVPGVRPPAENSVRNPLVHAYPPPVSRRIQELAEFMVADARARGFASGTDLENLNFSIQV